MRTRRPLGARRARINGSIVVFAVVLAVLAGGGSALADSGTFSGAITPTTCGPMHPITVLAGETTIDITAAMTISANDIKLELYDPTVTPVLDRLHGDSWSSSSQTAT